MRRITSAVSHRHWLLLMKHRQSYESLRKTLEAAIEGLDVGRVRPLTLEEELRERLLKAKTSIILTGALEAFIEGRGRQVAKMGLHEYKVTMVTGKPVDECSLEEVLTAYVLFARAAKLFGSIEHTAAYRGRHTITIHHEHSVAFSRALFSDAIKHLCRRKGARVKINVQDRYAQAKIEASQQDSIVSSHQTRLTERLRTQGSLVENLSHNV